MLVAVCHSSETGWERVEDLSRLSDLRAEQGQLIWAEARVDDLTEDDLELIAEEFGLHPLAVEDSLHLRQRPKFESYGAHHFAVVHQLEEVNNQLEAVQIGCFIGETYVLTVHAGAERVLDEAKRRWADLGPRQRQVGVLVHTVLDTVVDDYQDIVDRLEAEIENLEDVALARPTEPIQRQLYSVKQRLARLRRYVIPSKKLLEWIMSDSSAVVLNDETKRLFADVHDHLLRIGDQVGNVDALDRAVLELVHMEQASSLNDVNRRLTAWAAIFAVGTLIAGIYGMNFRLVPKDQTLFGFWFAIALMVTSAIVLYVNFKKRDWL